MGPGSATRRVGEHTIARELGRGGMGVVYEAHHPRLGPVALKLLLEVERDPEALARFRREAAALLRLSHRNVVPVHEVGEHEGRPFIAMAFVPGESLHQRLRRGPLDAPRAAAVTAALARALAHLHASGVIHRDLKPHNVILTLGTEEPVLVDFGLARLSFDRQRLTATGTALGTPAYMAPEQAMGDVRPTPAFDVYGLGATLHEMLCGRPPYEGANALAVLSRVLEGPPPPRPSEVRPDVDPELERLCLRCMERDPARRPDAEQVARALAAWRPRARRSRGVAVVAVSAALAAAAVGIVALTAARTSPPAAPLAAGDPGPPPPGTDVSTAPTTEAAPPTTSDGGAPEQDASGPRGEDPESLDGRPFVPARPASGLRRTHHTDGSPPHPVAAHDEAEARALALLRRAVPLAVKGREGAAEAFDQAELATRLAGGSARVRLTCAWIVRRAAMAGAAEARALLDRAREHLDAATRAGAPAARVQALREQLAADHDELVTAPPPRPDGLTVEQRFRLALRLRQLGRNEEAIELLSALVDDPDHGLNARFNLAGALSIAGRHDEAARTYADVVDVLSAELDAGALAPASVGRYLLWCHMRLADIGLATRDAQLVLGHAGEALLLPASVFGAGDVGRLHTHRALALVGAGRAAEAERPAREALAGFAADALTGGDVLAQPTAALACALRAAGRDDEARATLERAFALADETTLDVHWVRSTVHELALQAFPDDPAARARAEAVFP